MSRTPIDWISVGGLAAAFEGESNCLPPVEVLAGQRLSLSMHNGIVLEVEFTTGSRLSYAVARGDTDLEDSTASYRATEIRPGILFVDFIAASQRATTLSLLLDWARGICTVVVGLLPALSELTRALPTRVKDGSELTGVVAAFWHGTINSPWKPDSPRHSLTEELVGKRIEYTYSRTERYEHFYLNSSLYTWHCLAGAECGLADTDQCHYYKLGPQLYLFVWREKIVPTLGVVIVDLHQCKTTGKIFGYRDFEGQAVSNFPIGARARVLT